MTLPTWPRKAFTLIELMIAMTLTIIIVGVATTTFLQMFKMTRKLQARQNMDSAAKTLFEKINRHVTSMQPGAAVWLRSTTGPDSVELLFMRGKEMSTDYPLANTEIRPGYSDLVWSRWYWSGATDRLEVSDSTSARYFQVSNGKAKNFWKWLPGDPDSDNWLATVGNFSTFLSVPRLRRETGTALSPNDPQALLDENSWQSGVAADVGDYGDLVRNARPLLDHCTALTIELQCLDGTTQTADGSATSSWSTTGGYVDARNKPDLGSRPCQVRIRFTLEDVKTKSSNTYSFTSNAPAFTRY